MLVEISAATIALILGCDNYEVVSVSKHENVYLAGMDKDFYFGTFTKFDLECVHYVDVAWNAPTLREDGTALSLDEIGGYTIITTIDERFYSKIIIGPAKTSYRIKVLGSGEACFFIEAFDTGWLKSNVTEICYTLGD